MTLQTQLASLVTRIGTEFKSVRSVQTQTTSNVGVLANLTTSAKSSLVDAVNEVNSKPSGTGGASINDAGASGTTTYSGTKITSDIAAARASLKTEILGGASSAYDTLLELQTELTADTSGIAAINTSLGVRLRLDGVAQTVSSANQAVALTTIGAQSAASIGNTEADLVAVFNASIV